MKYECNEVFTILRDVAVLPCKADHSSESGIIRTRMNIGENYAFAIRSKFIKQRNFSQTKLALSQTSLNLNFNIIILSS